MLSTYGKTLEALEAGKLIPESDDESHFLAVLKGEQSCTNPIEKAWLKYVKLARGRKQFFTLHSSASNQSEFEDDYQDDEFDVAWSLKRIVASNLTRQITHQTELIRYKKIDTAIESFE